MGTLCDFRAVIWDNSSKKTTLKNDPVKSIPPTTENWLRKLYEYSMNNNTSIEDKYEINYNNNKYNDTNTDTRKLHNKRGSIESA